MKIPIQEAVNRYYDQGFSVIPILADSKRPAIKWERYQHRRPTTDELRDWFDGGDKNVAIVCGAVSGGLAVLDIDDPALAERVAADVPLRAETTVIRTPRGGLHVYVVETGAESRSGPLVDKVADLKANGGYVLAPPSFVNERDYTVLANSSIKRVSNAREWATGVLRAFEVEVPSERRQQLSIARTVEEMHPPGSDGGGNRNDSLFRIACKLKAHGLSDADLAAFVRQTGRDAGLPEREIRDILRSVTRYKSGEDGGSPAGPILAQLSRVQRQCVQWLWQDRIPLGRLTGLVGDPGVGKSWLSLAVASAVTRGVALPGQESPGDPGTVLLLTAEDGLADTVRPRCEDMGADLERVTVLTAIRDAKGNERHPSLLTDIPAMESVLAGGGYKLVVLDPLNAYLGVNLDTHRDAALRSALTPLAAMAERWGLAVLFVHHLNKGQRDRAIYRLQGSIAVVAAARVVHLVGVNPDDESERVFTCIKNNLAPPPSALAFEITEGRFLWRGESSVTEAALLRGDEDDSERNAQSEAEEFLCTILADGPVQATQGLKEAREVGIAERTLRRARAAIGVKSLRHGEAGQQGGGKWRWSLPKVKDAKDATLRDSAPLTPPDTKQAKPASGVGPLNTDDGQRTYLLSLAETLDWPGVSLGEQETPQHGKVSVGVPGDRFAWEQAIQYWPNDLLAALIERLEAMAGAP